MEIYLIWFAAGLGFVWFLVHTIIGGREAAKPIRNSDLPDIVRMPLWMCFHMMTAILFMLPVLVLWGWHGQMPGMLWAAFSINGCVAIVGIVAQLTLRAKFVMLPQGYLFLPIIAALAMVLGAA